MQLESLKIFCDVVRHRSFSQAAQESGITQSAVSQIVSHLEKRMNVQLIDRSTRPLQLTAVGLTYFEGCKQLLEEYEKLEASIRNARVQITGSVRVAAIYSVGLGDMGQYVQRFQAELPKTQVHIDYVHPDRVYEQVKDGTADLGLVSYPKKAAHLAVVAWRDEEMVVACSAKHSLAARLALPMRELDGKDYVHFDKALVIRRRVDRFLREQGVSVNVVAEFDSIENIKQAVSIGAGVALLPEPTIRREVKARTLAAIPLYGCAFTRPLAIIHRRGHRLSAAAKRFMELLLAPDAHHRKNGTHRPGKG
ncbi:MAG: LysR family transcriptional regulator [Planctomycetes bacterium]|nr:LysR family transcriptional regulator [Planctomycetota bacterium]